LIQMLHTSFGLERYLLSASEARRKG